MAENKKYQQKKIQDTQGSGFGQYKESTGGGKVFAKGSSNTRTTRENGKERQEKNPSTNQPRNSDGTFGYKSQNGERIDPKYGPSRGTTVNPLLTGGIPGIKIEDVEKQFASQKGAIWDKYKDKWYRKGGEAVVNGLKVKVAGDAIWNVAKRMYDKVKGEFQGESSVFDKSKLGKTSQEAKAAQQKAKSTKEAQYVISPESGGIKGGQKELQELIDSIPAKVEKPYKKKEAPVMQAAAPEIKEAPKSEKAGIKYSAEDIKKIKDFFNAKYTGQDKLSSLIAKLDALSPEELDKQIDIWKSKGVNFGL